MATLHVPADHATIAAAITAAAAGDTVMLAAGTYNLASGVDLNKAITLACLAPSGAIIKATTPGSGTGIEILSNGCTVRNIRVEDYGNGIAVDPGNLTGFTDVLLDRCTVANVQFGAWVIGLRWTVRYFEIDRVRRYFSGDIDYMRCFGRNHYFYDCYFHGVNLPTDLAPLSGTDYGHTDCAQFYNQNGGNQRILIDCVWEECCFTDFVQGAFIANEFVAPNCIQNLVFRNCVFWGRSFTPAGNLIGMGSHGIFLGKQDAITGIVIENCFFRFCANVWTMDGIPGSTITIRRCVYDGVSNQGTVYSFQSGTPKSVLSVGTGNWLQHYSWFGANGGFAADITNQDGGYLDTLIASGEDWRGPNAGWRPRNAAAALYGPQIGVVPPVEPPVELGLWQDKFRTDTKAWGCAGSTSVRVSATRVIWLLGNIPLTETGNNTRTFPPAVWRRNAVAMQDNNGNLVWRFGAGDTNFWPTPTTVPGAQWFVAAYAEMVSGVLYVYGAAGTGTDMFAGAIGQCRYRVTNPTADPASWSITEQAWGNAHTDGTLGLTTFLGAQVAIQAQTAAPQTRPIGPGLPGNTRPSATQQTIGGGATPGVVAVTGTSVPAYKYIFGTRQHSNTPFDQQHPILARALQSEFDANNPANWQYWTGSGWSSSITAAAALWAAGPGIVRVGGSYDVMYHAASGYYYAVMVSDLFGGGTILARRSSSLTGPWSAPVTVYAPTLPPTDPNYFGANARMHTHISAAEFNGTLVHVDTMSVDLGDLATDDVLWFPEFAGVNIPALFG